MPVLMLPILAASRCSCPGTSTTNAAHDSLTRSAGSSCAAWTAAGARTDRRDWGSGRGQGRHHGERLEHVPRHRARPEDSAAREWPPDERVHRQRRGNWARPNDCSPCRCTSATRSRSLARAGKGKDGPPDGVRLWPAILQHGGPVENQRDVRLTVGTRR